MPNNINQSARIEYRRAIVDLDGSVKWLGDGRWDHNLILDSGLNAVAARGWTRNFTFAAVGTGTNPVERASGSITFSAAGGTVTASDGFFDASDVGRMLRLDTGEQGYIASFVSPTTVTWNGPDASASVGVVYYVNRTSLQTEAKRTNTYRTTSSDNGSSWDGTNGEWSFWRTFLFPAESAPVTYREVGWSWDVSPTALFGMDILPGSGDSLAAGQQYLIQVKLILRLSPALAPVQAPDVGSGGWNTEGDIVINSVGSSTSDSGNTFDSIDPATGSSTFSNGGLEPSAANRMTFATATFSLGAGAWPAVVGDVTGIGKSCTLGGYTPGSFTRTRTAQLAVSEGNGSIYGITLSNTGGTRFLSVMFDAPQTKDNTHTVTATFRFSWQRRF